MSAAADDPLGWVGTLLERKYRVDARVAEGGFGVVYRGEHIGLGRALAIKFLKPVADVSADERDQLVVQFLEEARLIARLTHPAVVKVIDAGVTPTEARPEGTPWIAMEWLDGETLADELARRRARGDGERSPAEVRALLRPVVEAMAEAHDAGIVHRDLNPSNLMLVPGGPSVVARILDFGVAKLMAPDAPPASSHTTTGVTVRACSLAYAAPEQLSGARTGPWTDVHALGLLWTELLCGRRPIALDDVDAYYRAAFDPARPTPASRGVDVGAWQPILARALALHPQDRYASARELLAAIDGAGSRRTRAPGRRWLIAILAISVLAAWPVQRWLRGAATRACESNAACSRPGAPAICRPEVGCVALRSVDCEPFADARALASADTVWFGTLLPRSGPDAAAFGERETHAVELARRDFAQLMSSATGALDRARPLGLVACDDAVDPHRAAHHLVDDLGVPAVIGFYSSLEAIELASSLFVPRRVLAIASLNTNPLVTAVPQPAGAPRLVWRTTYNSADAARALSAFVAGELEPALHTARPLRVAVLRPRNAAGAALSDTFLQALHVNGTTALGNGEAYRELTFEAEAPRTSPEYAALVDALLGFAPDVVLYAGNAAIVDALFAPLEARWPAGARRPRYASIALLPKELLAFIGSNADRRHRFFGVTPVGSTSTNARFVTHYNEVFADQITRTINPNASYDAFYLLAYASYTIPRGEPVTGDRLARGFARLVPPGRPIDVGLAGIFDAYQTLSRDASIDVTGATGALDFDLATGESAFDQAILCAGVDAHGAVVDGVESGLVYTARAQQLTGAMRCP